MRVLILEDRPKLATQIAALAEECGHTVEACVSSVEEAIRVARTAPIDLLIADIDLGEGGDGVSAAREMREQFGVKTVFVTGDNDPETRDRAQHAWPLAFLVKPFAGEVFRGTMKSAAGVIRYQNGYAEFRFG